MGSAKYVGDDEDGENDERRVLRLRHGAQGGRLPYLGRFGIGRHHRFPGLRPWVLRP